MQKNTTTKLQFFRRRTVPILSKTQPEISENLILPKYCQNAISFKTFWKKVLIIYVFAKANVGASISFVETNSILAPIGVAAKPFDFSNVAKRNHEKRETRKNGELSPF